MYIQIYKILDIITTEGDVNCDVYSYLKKYLSPLA